MQTKEWWNTEIKDIVPYNLSDGEWPILERVNLLMGPCKAFFLQIQPNFVAHLKLMWHPMLIMALLVLSIGFVQYVMNLLADVLNARDEAIFFVNFRLDMSQIDRSSRKWHGYINGT